MKWTQEDIALLGTASDADVAEFTGRTVNSVTQKRWSLNIDNYTSWTPKMIALLGTMSDVKLAAKLKITRRAVSHKRGSLGMTRKNKNIHQGKRTAEIVAMLKTHARPEVCKHFKINRQYAYFLVNKYLKSHAESKD